MDKFIITNGTKSISLDPYDNPEAWTWLSGGPESGEAAGVKPYYRSVPWLFRGVNMVASAGAGVPFDIISDATGDVIDSSEDYQNVLGFWPNPRKAIWLLLASQWLTGKGYLFNVSNTVKTSDLKYMIPTSITTEYSTSTGELLGFTRISEAGQKFYHLEDNKILYFWKLDPYVETQEPTAYPAKAALSAAQVLFNIDEFVAAYFKGGTVKPMMLMAKGMPDKNERDRMESWFKKRMTGIKNAFTTKLWNADSLTVETIGEGLESLSNKTLTADQRQSIAAALGVPQTKLFSGDAGGLGGGGVVSQDDKTFYNETVIDAVDGIYTTLNDQLLAPMGYRIIERHERMELFQEDENDRSGSLVSLAGAFSDNPKAALLSSKILGYDFDEETIAMIDELIADKETARENMAAAVQPREDDDEEDDETENQTTPPQFQKSLTDVDLDKWQRKSLKRLARGQPAAVDFESVHIAPVVIGSIYGALETAETEAEVKAVFADVWKGYP